MKYEEYAKGLWFDKESNKRLGSEACEVLNDVKEAVRKLLRDISNEFLESLERFNEAEVVETELEWESGFQHALETCKDLVKKHLGWVMADGER